MGKPLNILFLMEDLCFGGTQKQTIELASRLDRQKFIPSMLTLTGPTDLDGTARQAGVPVRHMGAKRKAAPFFFVRLGSALAGLRPDILVPCTALPNIWGRIWGKCLGVPVIVGTCRGGGAPARQHERFLWRLCDGIVCNSPALVQAMRGRGAPEQLLTYIPNGVDTCFFQPREAPAGKRRLIVCAARLAGDKDHETLLRAFGIVARQFPDAALRLVGEGPEESRLRQFALRHLPGHAALRVEFAGACLDMRPHYAEACVFALASRREGQPNVILEAMSCGLPVCATNVGGIPALVSEKFNGFLCRPEDPPALAENIMAVLREPGLGAALGANGRARAVESFSFKAMTQAHEELFEALWERRGH